MDGKWEVVNHQNKKQQKAKERKTKHEKDLKEKQKVDDAERQKRKQDAERFYSQYIAAAGKTSFAAQLTDDTLFSALYDVDEDKVIQTQKNKKDKSFDPFEGEEVVFAEDPKKKQKQKQPKKENKQKTERLSFAQVTSQLNPNAVKLLFNQSAERYPNSFDVQLKTLAEYLEVVYSKINPREIENDLLKTNFPLSAVKQDVIQSVKSWLDKTPQQDLSSFMWFLITTLIDISYPGSKLGSSMSGVGIRLLAQLIARDYGFALSNNLSNIQQEYSSPENQHIISSEVTPVLFWIFNQTLHQPSVALTVWFQALLPLLFESNDKQLQNESLSFIETILGSKKDKYQIDELTATIGFERLLIYKHASAENKTVESLRDKLNQIYSQVLDMDNLLGKHVSKKFMIMLLGHATSNNKQFRDDTLEYLLQCLHSDPGYFEVWREIYPKYISHSYNLLMYISSNWGQCSSQISGKDLADSIQLFLKINVQLLSGEFVDKNGKKPRKASTKEATEIGLCNEICETLISKKLKSYVKKASSGSGATGLIGLFVLTAVAMAYYTLANCCDLPWCKSNELINQHLHCPP